MNKIVFITLCFFTNHVKSQEILKRNYLVFTFEEHYKYTLHGTQRYFWVLPIDSLKSSQSSIYPLYPSQYSKSQFEDCKNGKSIDPSIPPINPNDYNFDSIWGPSHDRLYKLIEKKRRFIQRIKKTWPSKNWVTVTVYATAVTAEFCSCINAYSSQVKYGYKGPIYLADNFSENFDGFWNSPQADYVIKRDFSYFRFQKMIYSIEN